MIKQELRYTGKAKSVYATDDPDQFILEFRDDATAFNAKKYQRFQDKGAVNNQFNVFFMNHLKEHGIATHFIKQLSATESVVKSLEIIPLECVIRNRAAGSICKRLGLQKGQEFAEPIFEFFYKDDALGDPLINDSHILNLNIASAFELESLKTLTHKINEILKPLFEKAGFNLIDFKLEFGKHNGEILLGDEITPDGCRIWQQGSDNAFDKDRFREDKGELIEHYKLLGKQLGIEFN